MHNNLIMSMATMVESRDNSTGGHIRRTSEGVRLLIDAVKETGAFELSDTFCRNLIKAAPMHDLGKIAVEDAILRKPGRFTPEEFAVMKTHAPEGARIVHEILKDTDDDEFHILAENVAHYHHERWDGSGYPEGLKGEAIPPGSPHHGRGGCLRRAGEQARIQGKNVIRKGGHHHPGRDGIPV